MSPGWGEGVPPTGCAWGCPVCHAVCFSCLPLLAEVLGIDQDGGDRRAAARRTFTVDPDHPILVDSDADGLVPVPGTTVLHNAVQVLAAVDGLPVVTATAYARGRAVYLASHRHGPTAARRLENAILWAAGIPRAGWWTSNPATDVVLFPSAQTVVAVNNTLTEQCTDILRDGDLVATLTLAPGSMVTLPQARGRGPRLGSTRTAGSTKELDES